MLDCWLISVNVLVWMLQFKSCAVGVSLWMLPFGLVGVNGSVWMLQSECFSVDEQHGLKTTNATVWLAELWKCKVDVAELIN